MKRKQKQNDEITILIMNATTLSVSILILINGGLMRQGLTDTIHTLRGLWYISEIDHINVVELQAIESGV